MKEIKFRIWNTNGKVMHSWRELVEKNKIHLLDQKRPEYPVMQYTGLKDKNGVDLYEGDIYKHWGEVSLCVFEDAIFQNMHCVLADGDFEIVGNVHQNPELLS